MPNYKQTDMEKYVDEFLNGREEHGRYLSFEYCYTFFCENCSSKDETVKKQMALLLFMYLASWGMLRNSFLMYKDYTYLVGVVEILTHGKQDSYKPCEIIKIKNEIIAYFEGPIENPTTYITSEGRQLVRGRRNWDTLISKILMGTLGCVPAYDDFFRGVARKCFGMCASFSERGITQLNEFLNENHTEITALTSRIKERTGVDYPPMKIVDMYFWQKGYSEGISQTKR